MLYDLDTEEHIATYTWRINPMCKIGIKATKVHGIRLDDLANEPTFDAVAPLIRGVVNPAHLNVAHNGHHFDFDFIERECARVGCPVTFGQKLDTMTEARFATPYGKNPKLGELAACLGIPYDHAKAHGAEYDVEILAKCFFEGRRLGQFSHN